MVDMVPIFRETGEKALDQFVKKTKKELLLSLSSETPVSLAILIFFRLGHRSTNFEFIHRHLELDTNSSREEYETTGRLYQIDLVQTQSIVHNMEVRISVLHLSTDYGKFD